MNNFEKRTLLKKENIINAALDLFGEHGFLDVSIKDIAALAKVSQVSIYNYFGSKESLLHECVNVIMKDTIMQAEKFLISDICFEEKLKKSLALCNKEINISANKFLSKKAVGDNQFLILIAKSINSLKKEIYMKYITHGKEVNAINNNISDESIQLFIDAINNLGMNIPNEELDAKQNEIIHLFLYGIIGNPTI